ncbi:flagellar motor protein MotB [Pandoraea terrae]|uniref:Flagellar motor protein MotB n=1 Tax=Pandoraea terrae TaxID=1537710 RepID=A0A5E4SQQ3_9BURK|nr:OmpA family protein [Pandoraea terrae]VVD78070.1 flagellar motor protein MotB [Pandoraea terrae]
MAGYPYRTLITWIASLTLIWLAFCSPWSAGWNAVLAMLTGFLALLSFVIATRRVRARRAATAHLLIAIDTALLSLPGNLKRNTPLVLAVSDANRALDHVFGVDRIRITDTAIWVRAGAPADLMHLADALQRWRGGQGPDAVAHLIAADKADSDAVLGASLKRWRSAIGEASRAVGYPLPVCVAVYAEEARPAPDECPWFGVSGSEPLRIDTLPALVASRADQYTRMTIAEHREPAAYRSARLDALTRWACRAVLPALVDTQRAGHPLRITSFGVTGVQGRPAPASPYGQFVADAAGLTFPSTGGPRIRYPLPEALIRGIPRQPVRSLASLALAHAFVWLALGFCAAAAASAWQNRALVQRVTGHMAQYNALEPAQHAARADALTALKRDRDELERYASTGVPPRLGLGFYRGATLLPPVRDLIAGYQPPAPPPSTIELDSLSLFRSGSAALEPGSNRVLVNALEMIKANADRRVLVAGHTDAVGNPGSNLKLSEARAASVRDWLADASGIPSSHFAIQGYGDTRPKASNDTAAGRAANRRVEITLVPDCRDDRGSPLPPQGHPACS